MNWIARLTRVADDLLTSEELEAELAAIHIPMPPPQSILDRAISQVERGLNYADGREVVLEAEIADLTEQLRQTRITKQAFTLALVELRQGVMG